MLQRVAMDYDYGRIHAPLVGISELWPIHAGFLRRLKLNRFQ